VTTPPDPEAPPPSNAPPPEPSAPSEPALPAERPLPRGCHPLVFGVVMATLQLVATLYFMGWC